MNMDRKTINIIISKLKKVYDISEYENRGNPFQVLIGTVLSQRTKDEITWPANERLFKIIKKPEDFLRMKEEEIEKIIYPVGFYKQKAKRIKQISKELIEKYDGKVPNERKKLISLPGVGEKTADCVLCFSFGKDVIPVDIHVEIISKRLGIADWKDSPEIVRKKLHRLITKDKRKLINALFVEHGKNVCTTKKAYCNRCVIYRECPKIMK